MHNKKADLKSAFLLHAVDLILQEQLRLRLLVQQTLAL